MKRPLSELEADILMGACDSIAEILAKGRPSGYGYATQKMAYTDAEAGRVRPHSAWSGVATDDPAIRMRISRAYISLERRGLIDRIGMGVYGERVTHIAPTREGYEVADRLRQEYRPNRDYTARDRSGPRGDSAREGPDEYAEAYRDPQ